MQYWLPGTKKALQTSWEVWSLVKHLANQCIRQLDTNYIQKCQYCNIKKKDWCRNGDLSEFNKTFVLAQRIMQSFGDRNESVFSKGVSLSTHLEIYRCTWFILEVLRNNDHLINDVRMTFNKDRVNPTLKFSWITKITNPKSGLSIFPSSSLKRFQSVLTLRNRLPFSFDKSRRQLLQAALKNPWRRRRRNRGSDC